MYNFQLLLEGNPYLTYLVHRREDFKSVLHEVRRNNKNTLSGLSLDSITEQVKAIINSKDKGRSSSSSSKGATGSGGGNSSKGRQNKSRTSSRQQQVCKYNDWHCHSTL